MTIAQEQTIHIERELEEGTAMTDISCQNWIKEQLIDKALAKYGTDNYEASTETMTITSPTKTIRISGETLNTAVLELV